MSKPIDSSQRSTNQQHHQLHWGTIAALWAAAAFSVIFSTLTAPRLSPAAQLREGASLALVAAACTLQAAWLFQHLIPKLIPSVARSFELGYSAGRADALEEVPPS